MAQDDAAQRHTSQVGHKDDDVQEGVEPDFTRDVGTTDQIESVEEAEPYLPPTDPVIAPAGRSEEGVDVVGGFSSTSADDSGVEGGYPQSDILPGDEQIQEAVLRELHQDARTAELNIGVRVRSGTVTLHGSVSLLEDADAAEEIAAGVEGVAEVRDQIEVARQAPR